METSFYVGCRVYDEQREIGFDSSQVKAFNCLSLCQHWKAILAGKASRKIQEPWYSLSSPFGKAADDLHSGQHEKTQKLSNLCGRLDHACHMGNPRGDLDGPEATYSQIKTISESFIQLVPGKNVLRRVMQVSKDGNSIETLTPIGERHTFKVLAISEEGNFTELQELPTGTPFESTETELWKLRVSQMESLLDLFPRNLQLPTDKTSEHDFIYRMISRHLRSSVTEVNAAAKGQSGDALSRHKTVARLILKKIKDGTPLTETDLETWNRILI